MSSLAAMAARLCGQSLTDISESPDAYSGTRTSSKPAWRRAPRTKAAFAAKVLAIEKAIRMLENANVPYAQLLSGKLVVEPPPEFQDGKIVTFWPAKERLGSADGQRRSSKTFVHSRKPWRIRATESRVTCPGGRDGWLYSRRESLTAIRAYAQSEPRSAPMA